MCRFCAVALATVLWAGAAQAVDTIKPIDDKTQSGTITGMTAKEVTLTGSTAKPWPVNEILWIQFDNEPGELTSTRKDCLAGRFSAALPGLNKLASTSPKREEIKQDIEFYRALATTRLALAGNGGKPEAGKLLLAFEKAHATNFHYFEICELLGDLFAATGKYDKAEEYYKKFASAGWPEYELRAAVMSGRALLAQKQYAKANAKFQEVIDKGGSGKEVERQKTAAQVGQAAALAGAGKTDKAIAVVNELIENADPEDIDVQARAYNILGNCYLKADKKKDALLAFLRVDLLFDTSGEQHAEALGNLATLWSDVEKADRATQARKTLKQRYPNSKWAEK